MPELPEVETMAQALKVCEGHRLLRIENICEHKLLKNISSTALRLALEGLLLREVSRTGKWLRLCFELYEHGTLYIHNSMFGYIRIFDTTQEPYILHKHDRAILIFGDLNNDDVPSYHVVYRDVRCWGQLRYLREGERAKFIEKLGPDAREISLNALRANFGKSPKKSIGDLLLRQDLIAGIGNIYRSEILWGAGISPFLLVEDMTNSLWNSLHVAIVTDLEDAIEEGGSSIANYKKPDGTEGTAQAYHTVYSRGGEPCVICKTPIRVEKLTKRKIFFCPTCQRMK
jgi:formamidopyrimidine-DNA glycosylase